MKSLGECDLRIYGSTKSTGLTHYRLSLSWPRLLPRGRGTGFNAEGLTFYNAIFSLLNQSRIQPLVTLYHWDIPQALEDEYGGWRSEAVVEDFANFADMAFRAFGRYVKRWLTFNEALTFVGEGYGDGVHVRTNLRIISSPRNVIPIRRRVAAQIELDVRKVIQI